MVGLGQIARHLVEQPQHGGLFFLGQRAESLIDQLAPQRLRLGGRFVAFLSHMDEFGASIFRIGFALDQPVTLEPIYRFGHGAGGLVEEFRDVGCPECASFLQAEQELGPREGCALLRHAAIHCPHEFQIKVRIGGYEMFKVGHC